MRIAVVLHDLHPGGTEKVAMRLAAEWQAMGHAPTLLLGDLAGEGAQWLSPELPHRVATPAISRGPLSRIRLGHAFARMARALQPDILFLPGNFHLGLVRTLARAGGFPVVGKISNPLFAYPLPFAGPALKAWTRGLAALAAPGDDLADEAARLLPDIPLVRMHNPVELPPPGFRPAPVVPDRLVLIGRLVAQKDIALAIATVGELHRRGQLMRLDIYGTGPLEGALRAAAQPLGSAVAFHGHKVPIGPEIDGAAALLMTSRYEGNPSAAVEALAHSVPVVTTDCARSLHGLLDRPDHGTIVPVRTPAALADAILAQRLRARPVAADIPMLRAVEPARVAADYIAWFAAVIARSAG